MAEDIRKELRHDKTIQRKEQRVTILNRRRVAFEKILDDASYTPEFVVEKATAIKKSSPKATDYDLLQNALLKSEENINAFLKVDNALATLARDVSGNNSTLQMCATSCCCNIACGNTKACTALAKRLSPYLVMNLDSLNQPLVEITAWTVGNLAAGSYKAAEILLAQGCFGNLLSLMRDCGDAILPTIVYATKRLVYASFYRIPEDALLELAQVAVSRETKYDNTDFIWLLALLSSSAACSKYFSNLFPSLTTTLYFSLSEDSYNISKVTALIRILANSMHDSVDEVTRAFTESEKYSLEDFLKRLQKLFSSECTHIRKETLWLVANLCNTFLPTQETVRNNPTLLASMQQAAASISCCI